MFEKMLKYFTKMSTFQNNVIYDCDQYEKLKTFTD